MELKYLDCCNSSFFNGYNGHTLAVPVDATMTHKDLKEGLADEWQDLCVIDLDYVSQEEFDSALDVLFEDVKDMGSIAFPDIEPRGEFDESCYCYVGIAL